MHTDSILLISVIDCVGSSLCTHAHVVTSTHSKENDAVLYNII